MKQYLFWATASPMRIIFLILPILDTAMSLSLPADRNMQTPDL